MFKNGQLVKCISSNGSIYIAEGEYYRVSHDSGKEICLVGVPGYYNSDAFTEIRYATPQEAIGIHTNHVDENTTNISSIAAQVKEFRASKNDKDKIDLSLIPYIAQVAEAKAFMVGEKKYGRYNYTKGHKASQLVAAAMRHLQAWNEGEENDPVDGQPHLGSVKACCSMILRQLELGTLKDDRYKK